MVKAEVKTPNKRKSIANDASAKKVKLENGNNKLLTPKKENSSLKNAQKPNKTMKIKQDPDAESPKKIKPFAGTKQIKKSGPPKTKKSANKEDSNEIKKKRRSQYGNLIDTVKSKQGTKDPEILKDLNQKIAAIMSREELSKTAKRKLAILNKLKVICEEGQDVAAAKSRAKAEAEKAQRAKKKTEKKAGEVGKPKQKEAAKKVVKKEESEDDDDDDEDSENGEDVKEEDDSDDEDGEGDDSDEAEEDEDDDDDEEDNDDDDEDDEDDSEEEAPAPAPKEKPAKQPKTDKINKDKQPSLDQLKNTQLVKKDQKRFVLFVGNIPYDTTKQDIAEHFNKVGDIVDIRIPTEKGSNKPRGFAYIEVSNETAYEKCLSMHHSQLKGRRLNVLYTQGGKKKGEDKKKEMKAKNMKLHALRKQGKLAGSVKFTQKRSFRRNKDKRNQPKGAEDN